MKEMEMLSKIVGAGKIVHTHASAVLITENYVYKIKKPVYFGFLDYRQAKQRRAYSILEKELNARYSEDIYMEVLKIIQKKDKYELAPAESSLPALEYVLKMRRIPDDEFLSSLIGGMGTEQMENIGFEVACRLSGAERSPEIVDDMGPYDLIAFNARENFSQLKEAAPELTDKRVLFAERVTEEFLNSNEKLFKERYTDGYIRDGHGDLRLEHIYIKGGKLGLIDCIEFNNRFRTNDVVSEAAFLSMELDYAGKIDLSDAFLRGFFRKFSDAGSLRLLNFYRCYRAMVRAKVAVFTFKGTEKNNPLYSAKQAEYQRMMDMAMIYAISMKNTPALTFCGMIATGKSVHSMTFAKQFPVKRVNTDEMRKKLTGLDAFDNAVVPVGEGIYTQDISLKVYSDLGAAAELNKNAGRITIADGTFIKKIYQEAFEKAAGIKPVYIVFNAPEAEIIKRLKVRESKASVTDGRLMHYGSLKDFEAELPDGFTVNSVGEISDNVKEILAYLMEYSCSTLH
ncbi:MAG: AAA family ATPase [Deferribacteraceae bacterium]|jgi:aminoglycoside phosphotransferase family enzyme/predicted kinase|nr:AAA family ATPase [Deferribacteraceae bacterium]